MSVIVIDMNGDLVDRLWRRLAAKGVHPDRIFAFDATADGWVPPFNPLLGAGETHRRVGPFVGALRGGAATLGIQVEDIAHSGFTALAEAGYSPLEIDALLANAPFRRSVVAKVSDPYTLAFFERYEALTGEQRQTWHLWMANKLRPFTSLTRLRRIFGGGSGEAFRKAADAPGAIVLVSLGVDVLGGEAAGALGRMLVESIWNTVLDRSRLPERERPRTRLVLDEFQQLGDSIFASMVAEGRRFGLSLALAHQSQVQLETSLRSIIRNNSAVRALFAPGPVDAEALAAELAPMPKAEAYAALTALSVGEAYVVRRGERAVAVKAFDSPDPEVSAGSVEALRKAVYARTMLPAAEVDAALAARSAEIAAMAARAQDQPEVSHEKRPWGSRSHA